VDTACDLGSARLGQRRPQRRPTRFGCGSAALCCLTLLRLLTSPAAAQTFTFTTIAGSVTNYGSADGTNTDAQFEYPSGIAVDQQANLFVADTSNNTIRKITPTGSNWVVTTIAGFPSLGGPGGTNDGTNADARFDKPNGVAVDRAGNLFVVDHYNQTIRKITPSGTNWIVTTIAGSPQQMGYADGTNSDARFWTPTGIAIDGQGNLFVADTFTFTIRKIASSGTNWVVTTIAGSAYNFGFADGTNQDAQFDFPFGLCVDASNNVYVADNGNHAIRKITPVGNDWVVTTVAGASIIGSANGTNSDARFFFPADITVDRAGNLYVTDQSNDTIRKIVPVGTNWLVSTIGGLPKQPGHTDGVGTDARFDWPWGITMDHNGILYVVDWRNSTIRKGVPSYSPPSLGVSLAGTQAIVSWPLSAITYVLQSAATLSPGATWLPITNGVAILDNDFVLTNDASGGSAFYRLVSTHQ
jgi:sugar lactone lactonase YvrE